MVNTYNYLKTAFQELKQENSRHPTLIFVILALLSIPLLYAANSISLGLLVFITLLRFGVKQFRNDVVLLLPVFLYLLMVISLIWTIDINESILALSKELPLLLIPLCFLIFPVFSSYQKQLILKYYSLGILIFCVFYIVKASVRYMATNDPSVFFYHELVTKDVNAIHVSVYVTVAFYYFFTRNGKSVFEIAASAFLFVMVFVLASKNIIVVFVGLMVLYYLFFSDTSKRIRLISLVVFFAFLFSLTVIPKIQERFKIEYDTMMNDSSVNEGISEGDAKVYNVSISQAWNKESFEPNDFFPGAAFRVYQLRIFTEMLREDNIFWTGYGLNASYPKIEQKIISDNLFLGNEKQSGYQKNNFHNQYIQNFAELGIFGLLLLLAMLAINLKNAVFSKDFVHISFAVLMISLFLTESFLWRQRGVTFFTVIYCLFNSGFTMMAPKKDNKTI